MGHLQKKHKEKSLGIVSRVLAVHISRNEKVYLMEYFKMCIKIYYGVLFECKLLQKRGMMRRQF